MPRPLRVLIPATAMILLLLSSACSEKLAKRKGLTDAALFSRGQQKMEQKKHEDAAEAFQLLVERFPNSPLAPRAQFELAASRMNLKEDIEAEVAFDDFLRLYPADPKVPDALFMKGGLAHRQILAPGRAQEKTREAIGIYRRFLEKEPGTPRAAQAAARIVEMRRHLVLHEEDVISHLLSRKLYESAELRAKRVLEDYPDAAPTPALLTMLAEALEKQEKKEEASQVLKARDEKFPRDGSGKR
jgi:outer membrane protein assembly factor BamD